ncbi:MAG TPA: tyrosine-type recombinase/integrase [Ktedonobacteraceae bacterium]
MGHRGHGEGSIYQRNDGRWTAAITLDNHRRKTFYGKSRKEVQDKLNKALYEQKQGTLATGPQMTLKTHLERWLEQVCKLTMRASTYKMYRSAINFHWIPSLGHIKLQKLTIGDLQAFYAELQKTHKPRTMARIHAALSSALEDALKQGFIGRNVAKLVDLPHIERYEGQILTVEQARKLLEVARGSRYDVLLLVAVTTGMRRGELVALRWVDVDLEYGMLQVRHTVSRAPGMGCVEGEPKTKAGRRKILLSSVVMEALKEQKVRQEQVRIKAGDRWRERGLIFSNKYGGFLNPDYVWRWFKKLLRQANLPDVRFHDLRHGAATVLLAAKVDLKVVSELLGHSSVAITADIYAHVLPEMQQEVVKKMDDLYGRS